MNQNIFDQLAQDQANYNAYQDRFRNELTNFDMDKRTQQITQQASNYAVDQAKKASGALSNQLLGTDITQTAVEAAPLLYKGGRYFYSKGVKGVANAATEAGQNALDAVQNRVGGAINTVRDMAGRAVNGATEQANRLGNVITSQGEDGFTSVQQRMQSALAEGRANITPLAQEPALTTEGAQGVIPPRAGMRGESTLARATRPAELPDFPAAEGPAPAPPPPTQPLGRFGRGSILTDPEDEFRVEGGQLLRAGGAPADFSGLPTTQTGGSFIGGDRLRNYQREYGYGDDTNPATQSNLDRIFANEQSRPQFGELPPERFPAPPPAAAAPAARAPAPEPELTPEEAPPVPPNIEDLEARAARAPPTAAETFAGQGGRINPQQPELSPAEASPYQTDVGERMFTRARTNADFSSDNPSITSENPIPSEPASGAQVNLTPWEPPGVGEPKYDPSSVLNPLERGPSRTVENPVFDPSELDPPGAAAQDSLAPLRAGMGDKVGTEVGGEVGEGLGLDVAEGAAADVAAPELALAEPVLGAVEKADIPVVSSIAGDVEDVGKDIEKGFEDIFGGGSSDASSAPAPAPQPTAVDPANMPLQELDEFGLPKAPGQLPARTLGPEPNLASAARGESGGGPGSGGSLLGKVEKDTVTATEEGGAELPGVGEALMGVTALAGLGATLFEHHAAQKDLDSTPAPVAPPPVAAPSMPGLAFSVAPTIDSTNYHSY